MDIEVKWIKILTGMFDDEKIKLIEAMPEADMILVIWVKLLTLAGKKNMNGFIFLTENIPYTDEMLSAIFNRPLNMIRLALDILKKFGMIQYNKEKIMQVTNWNKHQNIEGLEKIKEQNRLRQREFRKKQKKLPMRNTDNVDVTLHNGTEEKRVEEKKKRKEKDKEDAIQVLTYLKSKVKWIDINPEQKNKRFLFARLKDGASVEDCKAVIDIKFKDEHFRKNNFKFMQCSTLFRETKFQDYLQEAKGQQQTREFDNELYG